MELPCFSITVDVETYQESVLEILSVIRPTWPAEDIQIEKLTKGYLNCLLKCSTSSEDAIIVRVFGDIPMLHRESEVGVVKLASDAGVFPQLFCRFNNGIAYKYTYGIVATRQDLNNEKVLRSLANLMHEIHQLEAAKPILEKAPRINAQLHMPILWQSIMNSDYTDVLNDPRYKASLPPFEELEKIMNHLLEVYQQLYKSYPLVCCHGDPHVFNIVYNSETEQVTLLDWETCTLGPEIMDIAILIDRDLEFTEVFHCSESRKKWLQIYLSTHPTYGKQPITDALFQQWYRDSLKASMGSTVFLAIFFIESMKKDAIKSDAIGIAAYLFKRYKQYKDELESLEQE